MAHYTVAQTTPLEATISDGISLSGWIDGMARLLALAYESADANWVGLNGAYQAAKRGIDHMVYEGDISLQQSASSALHTLFLWQPALREPLKLALARTDKGIGRKVMVLLFADSLARSRTNHDER